MKRLVLVLMLLLTVPAAASSPAFRVSGFHIVGNTVMSEGDVQGLLAPARDREVTLQDLHRLAAAVTQTYRARGYFLALATIPPQQVLGGLVTVSVSEGRVGRILVQGNRRYDARWVQRFFAPVQAETVPRLATLDRCVRLLNDLPDVKAKVHLKPGLQAGETDVLVNLTEEPPLRVVLEADNLGNQVTGRYHAGGGVDLGSVVRPGDRLILRGLAVFPSTSSAPLALAAYVVPLDMRGTRLALSGSRGEFRAGQGLQVLDLRGQVTTCQAAVTWPTARGAAFEGNWLVALEAKSFANVIAGTTYSHDEIRTLRVGWLGEWYGTGNATTLAVGWTQGLGTLLGGTPPGDPLASRPGARDAFGHLDVDWRRLQQVGTCTFVLRAGGQWATAPLLAGEQLPLGGVEAVRGYPQGSALVDSGVAASAELRVPLHDLEGVVFVDHGEGWGPRQSLTGVGIGVRAKVMGDSELRADLGFPLSGGGSPVLYLQVRTRM